MQVYFLWAISCQSPSMTDFVFIYLPVYVFLPLSYVFLQEHQPLCFGVNF